MSSASTDPDVVIVGAGLSGLRAAIAVADAGRRPLVVERSDGVGGRVRTDEVDGHLLDRGFQVLLTAYPELITDGLEICPFAPGARVRIGSATHTVGDPFRRITDLPATAVAPVGSLFDKLQILRLRSSVRRGTIEELLSADDDVAAIDHLRAVGFSSKMIERFLRPLFGGITLEPDLLGSARVLRFVFRMLSEGDAAVPAGGMGRLADALVTRLGDRGDIELGAEVSEVGDRGVVVDGRSIAAGSVIVATGATEAAELVGTHDRGWNRTTTWWFGCDESPEPGGYLVLDGGRSGPVNQLAVLSDVSSTYAPEGRCTVAAVGIGRAGDAGEAEVRRQLAEWYGPQVDDWALLRTDDIERAQPKQPPGWDASGPRAVDGVIVTGDHCRDSSLDGALATGRIAGEIASATLA